MPDDLELMARVKEGEQSALELLFARWEGRLFAYFHRLGCHPSGVEDLVEEALVTLYRRRGHFDVTRPLAPWVYGIARLVWKNHRRHCARDLYGLAALKEAEALAAPEPNALRLSERREEAEAIRTAIQGLPAEQREAFILRHYHGLSYEEIAKATEAPLGTVKWRIHDAMRRLEAHVAPQRVKESVE